MSVGIIIVALALGITACGSHRGHRGMDEAKILKRVSSKLDLTDLQQGKLQQVLSTASSFKAEMKKQHGEFATPLQESLNSPELDVAALNQQFADFETEFSTFRQEMITDFAEFHASLDDDQRNKLSTGLEKMEKHRRH